MKLETRWHLSRLRAELASLEAVEKASAARAVGKSDEGDRIAADLRKLLIDDWALASRQALDEVASLLDRDGALTLADTERILDLVADGLGTQFPQSVADDLGGYLRDAYELSMVELVEAALADGILDVDDVGDVAEWARAVFDTRALGWIEEHHSYWVGRHYDDALSAKVLDLVQLALSDGLSRRDMGVLFEAEMGEQFGRSLRYWENFANHATTRSQEFGRVDGYVAAGVTRYRIAAVMDERTSDVCRALNGKVFEVSDAVAWRERIIEAGDPEAIKELAPWPSAEQAELSEAELTELGVLMSPFHFGCRTRTVLDG